MTDDLCFTPATELAPLIRRKELSPVELIDAVLARIEACEPRVNAFATLTAERTREAARSAEAKLMQGDAPGSLFGLPVTIKDLTETAGIPTERGTYSLKGHVPTVDAPVIPRLEEAGAIILGKTTTSEFGWSGVSHSPLTGITSNPWKEGYNTGASSAGAGAAAAAGYGPLHQGSDGAGSIRMPAHFSGIFGLKPTYGRVPNWPVPNNDQISHVGPMTRTVGDAALMLQAMAGPHPWDHTSLEAGPADYPARLDDGIAGLKVAFSPDLGHARVDADVAALVQSAAEAFQSLGCTVESPALPFGPEGPEIIRLLWPIHLHAYRPLLAEFEDRMDPGLVACIRAADGVTGATYLEDAGAQARLCGGGSPLLRGVGPAAYARGLCTGVPGRAAAAGALAVAPVGLDHVGRVLLSLQLQPQSCRLGALRLHRCRAPRRAADRGQALRRPDGASGRACLRAGAPLGRPPAGALRVGTNGARAGPGCRPTLYLVHAPSALF